MNDADLDARLRDHFSAAAGRYPAPEFDAMLRAAQLQARAPQSRRWQIGAAGAVAAAVLAVLLLELRPPSPRSDDALLIAQLSATTYWTAPSDRWLVTNQSVDYLGLPQFDDMTDPMQEMQRWF
jgi:hypothetical protein